MLWTEESQTALWDILKKPTLCLQYINDCNIIQPCICIKCNKPMELAMSSAISYLNMYADGIFMKCKCFRCKVQLKPPYDDIGTNVINVIKLVWSHWNRKEYKEVLQYNSVSKDIGCREKAFTDVIQATRNRILEIQSHEITQIGGKGCIVEIDETFMNKRKQNVGRMLQNAIGGEQVVDQNEKPIQYWIFGGVERRQVDDQSKQPLKGFYVMVQKRDRKTLEAEILKHIRPGTMIYSDMWHSYNNIIAMRDHNGIWCHYNHFSVNHKRNFVNPVLNNIHTQNIERRWGDLKQHCKRRGYRTGGVNSSIKQRVSEYEFKRNNGVLKVSQLIKKLVE
ncbi:Conserved_hypothetical protein [Hexamita inflata]|uniref:ISXO2-like transposase domain-containing protein n=1 Tax=Hexamita inflata TaxID=28002 RepID=A0AA86QS57_9EUKA|nr:Conserved hypothetical protein [Hexamita inflata]